MRSLRTRDNWRLLKEICSVTLIVTFLSSYILPPGSFAAESANYRMSTFVTSGTGGESSGATYDLRQNTMAEAVNGDLESENTKILSGYLQAISKQTSPAANPAPEGSDRLAESANFRQVSYLLSIGSCNAASANFNIPLAAAGEPFGGVSESYSDKFSTGHLYTILNNPPVLKQAIPFLKFPVNSTKADAFDLDDYFTDPDGESLVFSVKGQSNIDVSIDPVTHLVSFSQLSGFVGTENITITAADAEGNRVDSNAFVLYVYNTGGINNAPVFIPVAGITVKEGELVTIVPSAIDPDGDTLTYSYSAPFNIQGQWQTSYESAGTYNVTVTVSDGSLTDTQQVRVTVLNVNRPPILSHIGDISVNEGQLVTISAAATDADGDTLTYSFDPPFNSEGMWQTNYLDAGVHNVTVTVSDGNLTDSQNVVVNVANVNTAPAVSISLSRINIPINEYFSFIVNADDADYDSLTLVLQRDGEQFFSGSVYDFYVGTTYFSSLGKHTIKAIVTDGHGGSTTTSVNVEVIDMPSSWGKILPLLGDFNSDGLVDIGTYNKDTGRWAVSLSNFDGFGSLNEWLTGFGGSPVDYQYVNGDFNADAITDIAIYNQTNGQWQVGLSDGTKFTASGGIWTTFSGSSADYIPFTGDFNGDGVSDVGIYDKSNGSVSVALSEKNKFSDSPACWLTGFSSSGQPFTGDFNGDGLTDIGVFNNGSWSFAVSNGTKFISQTAWALSFGSGNNPVISDFNNDGLTDIGVFDKTGGSWQIYHCNGSGFILKGAWLTNFGKSDYVTPYALDFNGDGLTDAALFNNSNFTWQRLAAKGTVADLMKTIANGLGGTTEITYKSSLYYDNTGGDGRCDLPFAIQTVSAVKQSDGLGHFYYSNYSYAGGLFVPDKRDLRGFGYVKVIDAEGSVSETYFKQDDIFKGLPYKEQISDSSGKVYSRTLKDYNSSVPYAGCVFPYLSEEESHNYDGELTAKVTKAAYEYDSYGNPAKVIHYGDTDISGDEKEVDIEYVYNTAVWILGLPSHNYVKDASGNVVSESRFYYDNHQSFSDTPAKGNLTKEEKWLEPKPAGVTENPAVTMAYDNYGNLWKTTDAKGNVTTTTYDTIYHAFPVVITNSLGYTQTATYDIKTGQVLTATDFNGQTGHSEYDVFGRLIRKFGPNDDATHPCEWYGYDLTTHPGKITISMREEYNTEDPNKIRVSYSFFDGLGRTIQTKTEAEDSAKQIVSGVITFDSRGLVKEKFLPYFTAKTAEYSIPALDGTRASYEYDPLGRQAKTINPDGTASRIEYNQWTVTTIDENGHKLRKTNDAYGRVVKAEEFNHGETYTTTYKYDTSGNLTSITDNQGNITAIGYNSLNQKISLNDPDMGIWSYEYDILGNLKKQTDAKGQIVEFNYDVLNRITEKLANAQITVSYYYDDPLVSYSKGRLTKITDSSGTVEFFYDNLGSKIKTIKTVDGAPYVIECAYNALGRMKSLKYPDGETVNYAYNRSGEIKTIIGNQTYVSNVDYNQNRQMLLVNYGNGAHTDYDYNAATFRLNHLTTNDGALQDLRYQFDNAGNVKILTDSRNTATQSFTYDDLNRLTSAIGQTYGAKYYRYDSIGNMIEKEGVKYNYGEDGAGPHALTSGDNGLKTVYDANGNMISKDNKIFEYDAQNHLVKAKTPAAQREVTLDVSLTAGWNFISVPFIPQDSRIGEVLSSIQPGADYDQASRYNPLKQAFESYNNTSYNQFDTVEYGRGYVIYVTNPSGAKLTLSGRTPGSVWQMPLRSGWNLVGTPSAEPVKVSDAFSSLVYGADYDRVVKYNSSTGAYEDLTINDNLQPGGAYYIHALKDATWNIQPGYSQEATEFVYDGDGGRVKKTTGASTAIYIGSLYEVENGIAKKHIFLGANRIVTKESTGGAYYCHSDHLGSSNIVTDQTGNQVTLTEFTPYGSVIKQTGAYDPKYKFTGKELDSTGLYYYGARYYDAETGRFITADPTVQHPYDPQDLNRYSYARSNPLRYTDPSGYGFKDWWQTIVGIATTIVSIFVPPLAPAMIAINTAISAVTAIAEKNVAGFVGGLVGGAIFGGIGKSIGSSIAGTMSSSFMAGAIVGAVEFGIGGFGAGLGAGLASGRGLPSALKSAGFGAATGAVMGAAIEGSYMAGWQKSIHGLSKAEIAAAQARHRGPHVLTEEHLNRVYQKTYNRLQDTPYWQRLNPFDEMLFDTNLDRTVEWNYRGRVSEGFEVNYLGIGMYEAWKGNSLQGAQLNTDLWKLIGYRQMPSKDTFYWLEEGYNKYNELNGGK